MSGCREWTIWRHLQRDLVGSVIEELTIECHVQRSLEILAAVLPKLIRHYRLDVNMAKELLHFRLSGSRTILNHEAHLHNELSSSK